MKTSMDHVIDRGDHFVVPFEDLCIPIRGKRQGNCFEGAALIYAGGSIEIELGDPPWNGVDHGGRTELSTGYPQERALHDLLAMAYKQQFPDVVIALCGLNPERMPA